jgi:sporulation protein YlmC with PRC-barrel domain
MLRRASEILGKHVNSRDGDDLGEIGDLIVNMGKGTIHYAVLEFNPPLGGNSSAVMVPLRSFDFSADRGDAVLRVDKSSLAQFAANYGRIAK